MKALIVVPPNILWLMCGLSFRLYAAQQGSAVSALAVGLPDTLPPAEWLSSLRPPSFPTVEAYVSRLVDLLDVLSQRFPGTAPQLHSCGAVRELFVSNLRSPAVTSRGAAMALLVRCTAEGGAAAARELASLIRQRVTYAIQQHHGMDISAASLRELELVSKLVKHHQVGRCLTTVHPFCGYQMPLRKLCRCSVPILSPHCTSKIYCALTLLGFLLLSSPSRCCLPTSISAVSLPGTLLSPCLPTNASLLLPVS